MWPGGWLKKSPCPSGGEPGEAESRPWSEVWEIPVARAHGSLRRLWGLPGTVIQALSASPAFWGSLRARDPRVQGDGKTGPRIISKALKSLGSESTNVRRDKFSPPCGDMWYSSQNPGQPAWWGEDLAGASTGLGWGCLSLILPWGKGPGGEIHPTPTKQKSLSPTPPGWTSTTHRSKPDILMFETTWRRVCRKES